MLKCLEAYGTVLARVVASGSEARSGVMDRMIAATALVHGLTLVSRDRGGFVGLEDLLAIGQR